MVSQIAPAALSALHNRPLGNVLCFHLFVSWICLFHIFPQSKIYILIRSCFASLLAPQSPIFDLHATSVPTPFITDSDQQTRASSPRKATTTSAWRLCSPGLRSPFLKSTGNSAVANDATQRRSRRANSCTSKLESTQMPRSIKVCYVRAAMPSPASSRRLSSNAQHDL